MTLGKVGDDLVEGEFVGELMDGGMDVLLELGHDGTVTVVKAGTAGGEAAAQPAEGFGEIFGGLEDALHLGIERALLRVQVLSSL